MLFSPSETVADTTSTYRKQHGLGSNDAAMSSVASLSPIPWLKSNSGPQLFDYSEGEDLESITGHQPLFMLGRRNLAPLFAYVSLLFS